MNVKEFDFTFKDKEKLVKASCSTFQVKGHHKYPMYRVVLPKDGNKKYVYIFYKTDDTSPMFFSYVNDWLSTKIKQALEKYVTKHNMENAA